MVQAINLQIHYIFHINSESFTIHRFDSLFDTVLKILREIL